MCQIDETPSLVQVLFSFGWIGFVHLGRGTKIRNAETGRGDILQRTFQTSATELGAFRQIHLVLDAAQLECCKTPAGSIPYNRVPVPFRTAEGGDGDGKPSTCFGSAHGGTCYEGRCES